MEYLSEFIDNNKLEVCIKSNDISEVHRAIEVMVEIRLPFSKIIADDYMVDIRLTDDDMNNCEALKKIKYLLRHVKINPTRMDLILDITKSRINSTFNSENDLDLLLATLEQIKVKHEMEFTDQIDEIFYCLIKNNLFSNSADCKQLICHSILPYFLSPHNEDRLEKILALDRLDVICALHTYFISPNTRLPGLWCQIQAAMRQPQQKKSALFLLKCRLQLPLGAINDVIFESPNLAQFDHFIQLLEASDAKQLHLLQPSMHLLHQLNELHLSWQVTAWVVYLSHPHLAVVEATLCSLLEKNWWFQEDASFEELLPLVLRAFNMTSRMDVYNICSYLFQHVKEQQMNTIRLHCDKIAWVPSSFYYFHKTLLPYLTLDSVSILSLLNRLKAVPDKSIRDTFMQLHLKPKLLQYISYDKNAERSIKEVSYAVFQHYYSGDNMKWLESEYLPTIINSLNHCYNAQSCYQVATLNYNYLQFLLTIQAEKTIPEDFLKLSHRYLRETLDQEILNEFGLDILYQVKIAITPSFKNNGNLSVALEKTLLDAKNNFASRSIALQIYSHLPYYSQKGCVAIRRLWAEIFVSDEYKFDESTCKAFLKIHKLISNAEEICNRVLSTQTDTVIVAFLECLTENVKVSVLRECCKKLLDMQKSTYFKKACNVFFDKLSVACHLDLLNIEHFQVLFKESLHVRYLVTKMWISMKQINDKRILKLAFENCLIANAVRSKQEKNHFNIMMEMLQYDNYEEFLQQWYCYKYQAVVLNAMIICSKFNRSDVLVICKTHLETKFQKRYYTDSQIHMEKLRIYQLLVLLYQHQSSAPNECLFSFIFKYLCEENNQNDIKHFQMLLLTHLKYYSKIHEYVELDHINAESQNLLNVISVLYHIVRSYGSDLQCSSTITALLYHTMGANFKRRLVSQMSIFYLLKHATKMSWTDIINKYSELEGMLYILCYQREFNSDLNYIVHFNPIDHYTAETVLIDIPRLNNVCEQEWRLYPHLFREMLKENEKFCGLNFFNSNKEYSNLKPPALKVNEKLDMERTPSRNVCVQRKPLSECIEPNEEDYCNLPVTSGLIVVGSLVDSVANLGGLARTCHILGAATLVVHDSKVTKSAEFLSLSMSAERWLDIQEIKVEKIGEYLQRMRNEGYTIIGAEQTNQSVLLKDYCFQFKTVLLLGNERTGIPADLLTMLDTCVEIPQCGVVRSLNVHVAASLIIYEYSQKNKIVAINIGEACLEFSWSGK